MPRKAGYCLLQVRGNCLYVWQGWTARWLTLALTALLVGGTVAGFRADALGRSLVLALLAAALVGGLLAGHRPWVFDRAQRTVRRGRRCIARFEQVATVGVREQQTGEEGTTYATVLVLTSGQRMALNTIRTGQAAPFGELAYWIAQFTGLRGPIRNPRGPGA